MQNFNPLVSIVIPVYNGSNYMREAIDSAISQDYQNIEIIIVNDGSNDNGKTREIALSYGDKIRYFEKENGGVATALNLAIKEMKGEYFSWLSHDDFYYPNKILRQIEELARLEDKNTIIYSDFDYCNQYMDIITANVVNKYKYPQNYLNNSLFPLISGIINGCTLLISLELFKKFGFFDGNLRTTQDYDLWFGFLLQSKIKYINLSLIKSRSHNEQDSLKLSIIHKRENNDLWCKIINNINYQYFVNIFASDFELFNSIADRMLEMKLYEAESLARKRAFEDDSKINILLTSSTKYGGMNRFISDLSINLDKKFRIFILFTDNNVELVYNNKIIYSNQKKIFPMSLQDIMNNEDIGILIKNIIIVYNIKLVQLHGIFNFTFQAFHSIHNINIPIIYTAHDFHLLCISQNFLDNNNKFCNLNKEITKCHNCLQNNISTNWLQPNPYDISIYRDYINKFILPKIDLIIFPTKYVEGVFYSYLGHNIFSKLKTKLIETGLSKPQNSKNTTVLKNIDINSKLRIGIVGNIYIHKGYEEILKICQMSDKNKFEFYLFGTSMLPLQNIKETIYNYHHNEIVKLLQEYNIDTVLLLSICPETYSYTLTESWLAGIPVIASNIGAIGERVRKNNGGWLVDANNIVDEVTKLLEKINNDRVALYEKKNLVSRIDVKTSNEMAKEYSEQFSELITNYQNNKNQELISDNLKNAIYENVYKNEKLVLFFTKKAFGKNIVKLIYNKDSKSIKIYIFGIKIFKIKERRIR